jgi:Cys-rich four helix bundle protein (predicted Tat secretion target)
VARMMNRREMLTIAGAAAALVAARADAAPPVAKVDTAALTTAANSCAAAAEACLRHCIAMLSSGNASMAGCAKAVADLGPAARALAEIAPGGSAHVAALASVVGQIAKDCKAECDKHLAMAPCKACSDSCGALIATIK